MKKFRFNIEGYNYEVVINDIEGDIANIEVNGRQYTVEIERDDAAISPKIKQVRAPRQAPMQQAPVAPASAPVAPASAPVAPTPAPTPAPAAAAPTPTISTQQPASGKILNSPLPGTILSIVAKVGQQVKQGDVVLIMESMKMENNILADNDGTINKIFVTTGQSVKEGDPLADIA